MQLNVKLVLKNIIYCQINHSILFHLLEINLLAYHNFWNKYLAIYFNLSSHLCLIIFYIYFKNSHTGTRLILYGVKVKVIIYINGYAKGNSVMRLLTIRRA